MPGAMNTSEVSERLSLSTLTGRKWFVQAVCAHTGEGIQEGLDWLSENYYLQ